MLTILSALFEHGGLRRREILVLANVCKTLYNAKNAAVYNMRTYTEITGPRGNKVVHTYHIACGRIHGLKVSEAYASRKRDIYHFGQHIAYQHIHRYTGCVEVVECELRSGTFRHRWYEPVGSINASRPWDRPLVLCYNAIITKKDQKWQLVSRHTHAAIVFYTSAADELNPRHLIVSPMYKGVVSPENVIMLDRDYEDNLTIKLLGE